jgi:hypothetical protein
MASDGGQGDAARINGIDVAGLKPVTRRVKNARRRLREKRRSVSLLSESVEVRCDASPCFVLILTRERTVSHSATRPEVNH